MGRVFESIRLEGPNLGLWGDYGLLGKVENLLLSAFQTILDQRLANGFHNIRLARLKPQRPLLTIKSGHRGFRFFQ